MKNCPNCGMENADEARYCVKCGELISGPEGTTGPYSGEVISGGPPPEPEKKSKWWIWLIIGIAAFLLIVLGICCLLAGGYAMFGFMNR